MGGSPVTDGRSAATVRRVKRALAAAALVLAACSSGGDGEPIAAAAPATTVESMTTTTESAATRKADFVAHLGTQLSGEDPAFTAAAYDLAVSMCDLLDSTVTGPATDDATNDTPESDAVMSAALTKAALDTTSGTGLAPQVTATVMRLGAEDLCPQHSAVVDEYADDLETR